MIVDGTLYRYFAWFDNSHIRTRTWPFLWVTDIVNWTSFIVLFIFFILFFRLLICYLIVKFISTFLIICFVYSFIDNVLYLYLSLLIFYTFYLFWVVSDVLFYNFSFNLFHCFVCNSFYLISMAKPCIFLLQFATAVFFNGNPVTELIQVIIAAF